MSSPAVNAWFTNPIKRHMIAICVSCLQGASRRRRQWICPSCGEPYRLLRDPMLVSEFDALSLDERQDLVLAAILRPVVASHDSVRPSQGGTA